ncbi:protoporphyrinogen oxidase [Planococcus lenghuensis]|uniref:protoporphyrinogen oxidase n=1 Tax=Planococcus lenghuensis TaxID=2213202 RepID=UPI00269DA656
MRAAADLVLPKSAESGDQSVGTFFRRRFGREIVDNLIEPLLSGIYAGDIDRLSLEATFPQFRQLEREHRSLIFGIRKSISHAGPQPLNPGEGIYHTFRGGLSTVVRKLEAALSDAAILKGVKAEHISQTETGVSLSLNNKSVIEADAVVLAVPHFAARQLFQSFGLLESLTDMPSATIASISLAFRADAIQQPLDGTGFVVSRHSDSAITACTWTSRKWPHSTPEGFTLFRAYVGRRGNEMIVDLSDSEIEKAVLEDLQKTMKISREPEFMIVSRFPNAMPQYAVGHMEQVAKAKAELHAMFPMIELAGSSYGGVGIPDCVAQGRTAARQLMDRL